MIRRLARKYVRSALALAIFVASMDGPYLPPVGRSYSTPEGRTLLAGVNARAVRVCNATSRLVSLRVAMPHTGDAWVGRMWAATQVW